MALTVRDEGVSNTSLRPRQNARGGRTWIRRVLPRSTRLLAIPLSLSIAFVSGCVILPVQNSLSSVVQPVISPDGTKLAFVWTDEVALVSGPMMYYNPLVQSAKVYWCDFEFRQKTYPVQVDCVGPWWHEASPGWPGGWAGEPIYDYIHVVFSPDSRHLAVVSPHHITIIDTKLREHWRVSSRGELVTCLFWTGPDEIVYASHTHRQTRPREGGPENLQTTDRTFWRQKIHDSPDSRAAIYSEKAVEAGTHSSEWDLERPSPGGHFVMFFIGGPDGTVNLLNVADGTVRILGSCLGHSTEIAWKPDESAVLFAMHSYREREAQRFFLADPTTGKTEELTDRFRQAFTGFPLKLDPLWTADGRYVVVNNRSNNEDRDGCLVRPQPWEVIPLGKRLRERSAPQPGVPVTMYRLPLAGWVLGADPHGDRYAVDYAGRTFLYVGDVSPWGWAWSPDGNWAATVTANKRVIVCGINLSQWGAPHEGQAP